MLNDIRRTWQRITDYICLLPEINECLHERGVVLSHLYSEKASFRLIRLERSLLFGFTDLGEPVLGNDIQIKKQFTMGNLKSKLKRSKSKSKKSAQLPDSSSTNKTVDPRLPFSNYRQIFNIRNGWKSVARVLEDTAKETLIR